MAGVSSMPSDSEELEGDDNENSTGTVDPASPEQGCVAGELECGGVCVDCPTPTGTARHVCDDDYKCVVETCSKGFERCTAGCCAWEFEVMSGAPLIGPGRGALALDASSEPAVTFMDKWDTLSFSRRTSAGDWTIETIATGPRCGERAELSFDAQGFTHVGVYDFTERRVEYLSDASGEWSGYIVDTAGPLQQVGIGLRLELDNEGSAHLVYFATEPSRIIYASNRGGNWIAEELGEFANSRLGLAVAGDGTVYVSHTDHGSLRLHKYVGRIWEDEIIAINVASNGDLAVEQEGRLHALFNAGLGEVWHLSEGAAGWEQRLIDGQNGASAGELTLDSRGTPHVVYCYNCTDPDAPFYYDDLKYAWFDGMQWHSHIVRNERYVTDSRIAVNEQGLPQVIFLDNPIVLNNNSHSERALTWGRLVPAG